MSTVESEEMDMEESSPPPDPHAGLRKELDVLVKDSQVFLFDKMYGQTCSKWLKSHIWFLHLL